MHGDIAFPRVKQMAGGNARVTQGARPCALWGPRGVAWGGSFKREGTYMPVGVHVDVWRKSAQHCKATILQ